MSVPPEAEGRSGGGDRPGEVPGRDAPIELVRTEEELVVGMRSEEAATVRVRTEVETRHVRHLVPVTAEDVEVFEVEVPEGAEDSGQVETTPEGDVSIPVTEERLFVVRRPVVVKRVVVRRVARPAGRRPVEGELRAQRVVVEHADDPDRRWEARPTPGRERVRMEEPPAGGGDPA
ncbi:MAG TPA: DUF2382 domain-containing protein [Egibacteraceae bacterium]|nr:DUF2382 domain-containing protein [Egibacteraceae bacterium]